MKVDCAVGVGLDQVPVMAKEAELSGYHGVLAMEAQHDPFLPLLLAAEHTESIDLTTAIAVAFARNPMTLANIGFDLQQYSRGRFILGLGSQIQAHIERRFSMPWSRPAARMRELVLALRAIWSAWNDESKLDFRGEFYTHTLMTPMFNPGANPYGQPRIFVAAVGSQMTEVAGEVADGMVVHPFTTTKYLKDVTFPALERGLARSGRTLAALELSLPVFVATGGTETEIATATSELRKQIAFYGSTPGYRGVLEAHGWGELQDELTGLSKRGEWDTMGTLVDDDIFDAFVVRGEPHAIAGKLHQRFATYVDRINFYIPYALDPAHLNTIVHDLAEISSGGEL